MGEASLELALKDAIHRPSDQRDRDLERRRPHRVRAGAVGLEPNAAALVAERKVLDAPDQVVEAARRVEGGDLLLEAKRSEPDPADGAEAVRVGAPGFGQLGAADPVEAVVARVVGDHLEHRLGRRVQASFNANRAPHPAPLLAAGRTPTA